MSITKLPFQTVGELRKALEGCSDDQLIMAQVVGLETGAWNMESYFTPSLPKSSMAVLTLQHPQLKNLPMQGVFVDNPVPVDKIDEATGYLEPTRLDQGPLSSYFIRWKRTIYLERPNEPIQWLATQLNKEDNTIAIMGDSDEWSELEALCVKPKAFTLSNFIRGCLEEAPCNGNSLIIPDETTPLAFMVIDPIKIKRIYFFHREKITDTVMNRFYYSIALHFTPSVVLIIVS